MSIFSFLLAFIAAVAVPTFQQQAHQAQATNVRSDVQQVTYAVEACAAEHPSGSYGGVGDETDCTDRDTLLENEPALDNIEGWSVAIADDPANSYAVTVRADGASFVETHHGDGSVTKTCAPASAPGCTDGTW